MTSDTPTAKAFRIPDGFWAIVAIVAWALAVSTLINRTSFGLDEATARAVLFLWSIADQVASPVVTLGIPDFRAVYLIPAGALFSGSLLAVKLCTLVVVVATAGGFFRWRQQTGDAESPLLASGLFLLAPASIDAIDHIAIGPFLLLSLLLAAWADRVYRAGRIRFSGTYFAQLLLVLAAVSLHPAGLALPLVLCTGWLRDPPPEPAAAAMIPGTERKHVLIGIVLMSVLGLLLAAGWPHQAWLGNPISALASDILGFHPESALGDALLWLLGAALAAPAVLLGWRAASAWRTDRLGAMLALALAIAAFTADTSFALVALALLLYWGFPLLLRVHVGSARGFAGQRGVAFVLLIVLSTVFLSADRARYTRVQAGLELSAQDALLRALADSVQQAHPAAAPATAVESEDGSGTKPQSGPRVASQWPARTMIACRCSALPLPPPSDDTARFAANLRGTEFVVFDPLDPKNRALSRDFALLGGASAETIALQPGGVVLRLHPEVPPPREPLLSGPAIRG